MTTLNSKKTEKKLFAGLLMSLIVILSLVSCADEEPREIIVFDEPVNVVDSSDATPKTITLVNDSIYKISSHLIKFPFTPIHEFVKAPIVSAFIDTTNNQNKLCATIILCVPTSNTERPSISKDSLQNPPISNGTLHLKFYYKNSDITPNEFDTWIMYYEYNITNELVNEMSVKLHNDDPKTSRGTVTIVQKHTY